MLTLPTQEELAALKAAAEAATPGPWFVQYGDDDRFMCMTAISKTNSRQGNCGQFVDDDLIAVTFHQCYPAVNYEADDLGEFNSQYMAKADPTTILALLALIDAQKKQIADLEAKVAELELPDGWVLL